MRGLLVSSAAALPLVLGATYDFVVVGGGTAGAFPPPPPPFRSYCELNRIVGLTIANRLTENAQITVAVLEAGPNAEHLPEVSLSSKDVYSE